MIKWALLVVMGLCWTARGATLGVDYVEGKGFRLTAAGVPVSRASSVQLYAPEWIEGYYWSGKPGTKLEHSAADGKWVVTHRAEDVGFEATETVRQVDDTHLDWTVGGVVTGEKPARVEWSIGQINGFVIDSVSNADKGKAEFETAAGRVTVKVEEGGIELSLVDGRNFPDRKWAQNGPVYWLGVLEAGVKKDEPFKFRVSVAFTPKQQPTTVAAVAPVVTDVTAAVPVVESGRAFAARKDGVRVIPTPKSITMADGTFALTPETKLLIIDQGAGAGARSLAREVKARFGWDWRMYAAEEARPAAGTVIFQRPGAADIRPEGYWIDCRPDGLVVTARDNAGYYYAAQTIAQLIEADGDAAAVPACHVNDYPSLAFRGVHLFPGQDAMDVHRRLIENVIGRFKMNHIVLEADYTRWAADAKIWTNISVPKEQIAEYVRLARQNLLEVVPLVQSLGHMEWMFKNGANAELAEDPAMPYAYSVTNPATYSYIENIYEETMTLFTSDWFHIGHDEVAMRGKYPNRDQAKEWGEEKLFAYDTNRLHDWLGSKGKRTMMWGDVLLAKAESNDAAANAKDIDAAKRMRAAIPKDTVICDWHYTPTDWWKYTSLKTFRDAGFQTIACTWSDPRNIASFAKAAKEYGALGLLQTTWAGYSINQKTLTDAPEQFAAYILAAEYAWTGGESPRPEELGWNASEVFAQAMNLTKEVTAAKRGWMLNLSGIPGAETPDKRVIDLDHLNADDRRGNHLFWSTGDGYPAIVLGGKLLPGDQPRPTTVTMTCDLPAGAREIAFLHATAFPADTGEAVGGYEILYADGTTMAVPLKYGQDIRALTDMTPAKGAEVAWTGKNAKGEPAELRVLRVTNASPDKAITGIRFTTHHAYASPILLGVTATE